MPGRHVLEGDLGLVQAFGLAQQAVFRALASFGQDPVVDAVDGRMGNQWVLHQITQQHIEAEDVVGHQQLGRRGSGLRGQALPQGIGLFMHGLFELQTHHAGIDHQGQCYQQHVVAGDPQRKRHTALAQSMKNQQEEVVSLNGRGPVHRARLFMSEKLLRSIASAHGPAKHRLRPMVSENR
ncbi:hypothetical protein D3C79_806020 [compost metagenome]